MELLTWWKENKRVFPWRKTTDPYEILISEVLLHRTRAEQVVPVYCDLLKKYHSVKDLAEASSSKIRGILHPLGLHWRSELLHKMALVILEKHAGIVPSDEQNLRDLPGVGQYISSAVRCFAFHASEPLLDTNTVRILGRMFSIRITDSSRRSRKFKEIAKSLLNGVDPRAFNYALIDLGASVCLSRRPLCSICPLTRVCEYGLRRSSNRRA